MVLVADVCLMWPDTPSPRLTPLARSTPCVIVVRRRGLEESSGKRPRLGCRRLQLERSRDDGARGGSLPIRPGCDATRVRPASTSCPVEVTPPLVFAAVFTGFLRVRRRLARRQCSLVRLGGCPAEPRRSTSRRPFSPVYPSTPRISSPSSRCGRLLLTTLNVSPSRSAGLASGSTTRGRLHCSTTPAAPPTLRSKIPASSYPSSCWWRHRVWPSYTRDRWRSSGAPRGIGRAASTSRRTTRGVPAVRSLVLHRLDVRGAAIPGSVGSAARPFRDRDRVLLHPHDSLDV